MPNGRAGTIRYSPMTKMEELGATDRVRDSHPSACAPSGRRTCGGSVPGALVGAVVMYVAHRGLIDDAYITLSYASNVAEHLHGG